MIQQTALILTAGLILLFSFTPGSDDHLSNPLTIISFIAFFTFIPGVLVYILGRIDIKRFSDNYYGRFIKLQNSRIYIFLAGIFALAGFAIEVFYLKLPLLVDKIFGFIQFANTRALAGIIPLAISVILIRIASFKLERHVRNTSWTWRKFTIVNLKFMAFPLTPFIFFLLIADFIDHSPLSIRIFFISHYYIQWFIMLTIILVMYALSPYVIRSIWPAHPIPAGDLRNRIESLAEKENIKYREALIWNTSGGNITNAAMTGLMPLFRYVFLTDSLLNNFSLDEIETVVAHEFGHIKYRHMLAYLVFSLGYLIFYMFLYIQFLPLFEKFHLGTTATSLISAVITIFIFLVYFVFIFRFLSRRFELQSDLYAVDSTGKPDAFKSALTKLSEVNYMSPRVHWIFEMFRTHPSIHRRIDFIDRSLQGDVQVKKYRHPTSHLFQVFILVSILLTLLLISNANKLNPPGEIDYEIGRQYAMEGMINEAIVKFNDAVSAAPKNDRIHFALGILYSQKGLKEEAIKELEKTLEINPENKTAREKLKLIQGGQ
jgi:Zn-dependent protease with chaperone function